jgi:hypothetical protein
MKQRRLCELEFAWDASALPFDPFEPVMPLELDVPSARAAPDVHIELQARLLAEPAPSPTRHGALPVVFHGSTDCYADAEGLSLWDGASLLRVCDGGSRIDAAVHPSSIARPFHFSSITVLMALFLALRHHGYFHLHAAGLAPGDGTTWLLPGESGSGKSTLSLALLDAGAAWLSDDALLLRRGADGAVQVLGWGRKLRLTRHTAAAFPALQHALQACPPESARHWELDPRTGFEGPGLGRATGPFRLLFPGFAAEPASRLVPLDQAEALGRALHACAWVAAEGLPRSREQLDLLAALCSTAPAAELRVGSRILSEPRAVAAELRALVASRASPAVHG